MSNRTVAILPAATEGADARTFNDLAMVFNTSRGAL